LGSALNVVLRDGENNISFLIADNKYSFLDADENSIAEGCLLYLIALLLLFLKSLRECVYAIREC